MTQADAGGADQEPGIRKKLLWLGIPPLACALGFGLHWALTLPKAKMEPSTRYREKQAKKPPKRIKRSDEKFKARDADEVEFLVSDWRRKPLEREPELAAFADRHRALLNAAVVEARRRALEGMPDPEEFAHEVECRTVRCKIWLCGWPHEVELVESELSTLELEREPAYLMYEVALGAPPTILLGGPAKRSGADAGIEKGPDACLEVTVALTRDLPNRRDLTFPELETETETGETSDPEWD